MYRGALMQSSICTDPSLSSLPLHVPLVPFSDGGHGCHWGGVWRVACGVWRVACGVWRVACGVWLCGVYPVLADAEGNPAAMAKVKAALIQHHSALYNALLDNNPAFEKSRWGGGPVFGRHRGDPVAARPRRGQHPEDCVALGLAGNAPLLPQTLNSPWLP